MPDTALTTRSKTTIITVAEKAFTPADQINCSAYVRDVMHLLGDWLPDENANSPA